MILVLLLGCLFASTAEDLPEAPPPQPCNCQQNLQSEETSTDFSPTFPTTSFTCWGRYDGYYADVEVDCTIFHYCQTWHFPTGLNETVKWDFACPQSTIFNQKVLSCTPPSISFDCQESPNYYWVNYNLTTKTTTPAPAPTTELTTPVPNSGQQLIVGGIGAQSATIADSDHPSTPSHVVTSSDEEQTNSVTPEPNLDTKDTVENVPQSIRFPDSEHPSLASHSVTSSDQAQPEWIAPAHNFDQQQILFPDSERQDTPSQFSTSLNQVETDMTDPKHNFRQELGGTVSQPTFFSDSEHTVHSVTTLESESAAPVSNIQQLGETVPQPTSFSFSEHTSTPLEHVQEELTTPLHSFRQEIQGTETSSFKDSEPSTFYHPSTSYNPLPTFAHSDSSGAIQEEKFTTPQHAIRLEFRAPELTSFPDSKLPYSQVQTEVTAPVSNIIELLQGAIPQPTSFPDSAQLSFSTTSLGLVDTKLKDSSHEFEPTSVPESEHLNNPSDASTSFDKVQTEITVPAHNIVQLLQGTVPQPTSFPDSAQPSYSATSLESHLDTGLKTSVDNFEQEFRETAPQPTSLPDFEYPYSPSHPSASLDQVQAGVTAAVDNIVQLLQGTFPQSTSFPDSAQPSHSSIFLEPVDTELKDSVHNFEHSKTAPHPTSVPDSEHPDGPSYSSTPFDQVKTEVTIPVHSVVQLLQRTVPQPTSFPDSVQSSYSATSLEPVDTEVKTLVYNLEQLSETAPQSKFVPNSEHPDSPSYSSTPFDHVKTEVRDPVHNILQLLQGTSPQPSSILDSAQPSYSATSLGPGDTDLKDSVHNFEQKLRETAPQPASLPDSEHQYSPSYSATSGAVVRGELTTPELREELQGTQATSFPESEPFSKPSHSIPLEQVQPELKGPQHNFVEELGGSAPLSTTSYDSEHSSIPAKSSASVYEVHAYTPSYSATSWDQVEPEVKNSILNFGQEFRGTEGMSFPYTERASTSSYSVTSLDQVQPELKAPVHNIEEQPVGIAPQPTSFPISGHPSATNLDQIPTELKVPVHKTEDPLDGTLPSTYFPHLQHPSHSVTSLEQLQELTTPQQSFKHEFGGSPSQSTFSEDSEHPATSYSSISLDKGQAEDSIQNFGQEFRGTEAPSFKDSEPAATYNPALEYSSTYSGLVQELSTPVQNFKEEVQGIEVTSFPNSKNPSIPSHTAITLEHVQPELKAPAHNFEEQTVGGTIPQPTSYQHSEASTIYDPPAPSPSVVSSEPVQVELKAPLQNFVQEDGGTAAPLIPFQVTEQSSATSVDQINEELKAPVHSFVQQSGESVPQPTPFQYSETSALYSPPAPSHSAIPFEQILTELKAPLKNLEQELEGTAPQPTSFLVLEQPSATSLGQIEELKAPVYNFEQQSGESIPQPSFQHSEPSTTYDFPSAPLNSANSLHQVQSEFTTPVHNFRQEIHGTGATFVPDYEHPTTLSHSITSLDGVQEELKPTAHSSAEDFGGTVLQSTFFPDSEQPSDSASSVHPRETEVKAAVTNTEQQPGGTAPQSTSFYHPDNLSIPENSQISLNEVEAEVTTAIHNFGEQLENAEPMSFSYSPTSVNQVQRDSEHPSTSLHSGTFLEQEHAELKAPAQNSEQQLGGTVSQQISVQYSEPSSIYYPSTPSHSAAILDEVQTEIRTQEQSIRQEFGGTESTSFPDSEHPSTSSLFVIPLNQVQTELKTPVIETFQQPTSFPDSQLPYNPSDSSTFFDQVQTEVTIPVHNIVQLLQGTVPQPTSFPDSVQPSYSATSLQPVDTEVKTSVHNFEQLSETAPQSTFVPDSEHPDSPSYSSTPFDHLKTEVTAPVHNIVQLLEGTAPQPTSLLDSAQPLYSANSLEPMDSELKDSVHKFQEKFRETVPQPTSFPDSEHSSYSATSSVQVQGEVTTPEHIFREEIRGPEMTSLTSEYASTPSYSAVSSVQVQTELKAPLLNSEEIVGTASQLTSVQDTEPSPAASLDHVEAELKAPADNFVQIGGTSPQSTSFEISEHSTAVSLDHMEAEVKAPVHNFGQELAPQSAPFQDSENTSIPPHSVIASNLTQSELKVPVENLGEQAERAEPTSVPHWENPSHSATSLEQVQEELTTPQQSFKQEFGGSESQSIFSEDSEHPATPPHSFVSSHKLQAEVANPVHSSGQQFQGTEAPAFKDSESSTIYHESATHNPTPEHPATSWGVVQELSTPVQNFKEEVQGIEVTSFPNSENPSIPSHITLEPAQPELKAPAHNFEEQSGESVPQPTPFQYSEASALFSPPAPSHSAIATDELTHADPPIQTELKAPEQNLEQELEGTTLQPTSFQNLEQPSATSVSQIEEELKAPVRSFVQQTGENIPLPTSFQNSEPSAIYSPPTPSHSAIFLEQVQTELKTPLEDFEQELGGTAPQPISFQNLEQSSTGPLDQQQAELKAPVHNFEQQVGETSPQSTSFYDPEHPSVFANSPTPVHEAQPEPVHNFGQQFEEAETTYFPDLKHPSHSASSDQAQAESNAPLQNLELAEAAPQAVSFQNSEQPSADEVQDFSRTELPSFPESEHQPIPSHSLTSADIVQTASELAHPNSSLEFTQSTVIPDSRLWTILMNPATLADSIQTVTSPNLIESWSGSGEASGEVANDEDESQAIK